MSAVTRVLLLNPPGRRLYVRDNYCSYTSKTGDLWVPQDLLFQSAWLGQRFELKCLDAIAQRLAPQACLAEVAKFGPEAVLGLTGQCSLEEDTEFYQQLKLHTESRIFLSGDLILGQAVDYLQRNPHVAGVLTDFTTPSLAQHLAGERVGQGLLLQGAQPVSGKRPSRVRSMPQPQHWLFPLQSYSMALHKGSPVVATMTSFGCPYNCSFCMGSVAPAGVRPLGQVVQELTTIRRELGVRRIYFHDPLFGGTRSRLRAFCQQLLNSELDLRWVCNGHVDLLDADTVQLMRRAGCEALMLGLETASDETRRELGKTFTAEQARQVVARCRTAGITTLAYFLIGLPQEREAQVRETIRFAWQSGVDLASFNLVAPVPGSTMHSQAVSAQVDHSYAASLQHPTLSPDALRALRREAYLRFYLRPTPLGRQLRRGGWQALAATLRRGLHLIGCQLWR